MSPLLPVWLQELPDPGGPLVTYLAQHLERLSPATYLSQICSLSWLPSHLFQTGKEEKFICKEKERVPHGKLRPPLEMGHALKGDLVEYHGIRWAGLWGMKGCYWLATWSQTGPSSLWASVSLTEEGLGEVVCVPHNGSRSKNTLVHSLFNRSIAFLTYYYGLYLIIALIVIWP